MMANEYYCMNCKELTEHRKESSAQNPKPIYLCEKCGEINPFPSRDRDKILKVFGLEGEAIQ